MRTFALLFFGVIVGMADSGVNWTHDAVGQEGSIVTERLTPPGTVAAGGAVETNHLERCRMIYTPEVREQFRQRSAAAKARRLIDGDPTPEQIAQRCEAIQATWMSLERRLRWQIAHQIEDVIGPNGDHRRGWTPQLLRTVDFCVG
jgi:hypothetical protein